MPTSIVLDSTAIAALFFKDPFSERVDEALARYESFHTLDLAFAEVGNVAWKRVHVFKEDLSITSAALQHAVDFIQKVCLVLEARELLAPGLQLAVHEGVTIYDALFLSLAQRLGLNLLTTDEELHRKAQASEKLTRLTVVP